MSNEKTTSQFPEDPIEDRLIVQTTIEKLHADTLELSALNGAPLNIHVTVLNPAEAKGVRVQLAGGGVSESYASEPKSLAKDVPATFQIPYAELARRTAKPVSLGVSSSTSAGPRPISFKIKP